MTEIAPRILVAGASSDIGQALIPRLLRRHCAALGLHGFNSTDRLRKYAESDAVKVFTKDLSNGANAIELVAQFCDWSGGIDVLIQLTGAVARPVSWREISPEAWNQDLAVNLSAPFFLAREAISRMDEGGTVILTSNAATERAGGVTTMPYGVAKAGLDRVVKSLAKFAAPGKVRVNAVAPGFIQTRFHQNQAGRSEEQIEKRKESIPLPHVGTPADVADAIDFLMSDVSRYVNGVCLRLDGGDFL